MLQSASDHLPQIPLLGLLGDTQLIPSWFLAAKSDQHAPHELLIENYQIQVQQSETHLQSELWDLLPGEYLLRSYYLGQYIEQTASLLSNGLLQTHYNGLMAAPKTAFLAEIEREGQSWTVILKASHSTSQAEQECQCFDIYKTMLSQQQSQLALASPPQSPLRLRLGASAMRPLFPIQLAPSVLDLTGRRVSISYAGAIERLADLMLAHRPPYGRTLIYADGNLDYFGHFALQEMARLLGVRNLYGSTIWSSQALASGAEIQRGVASPFMTLEECLAAEQAVFILNGANPYLTHPLWFEQVLQSQPLDLWLIDVLVSETAAVIADRLSPDRILLIRPGAENHLALAIAHDIIKRHPTAVVSQQADFDHDSLQEWLSLAASEIFNPETTVDLLVPEAAYRDRLLQGIYALSDQLVSTATVIHCPGSGLLQSGGTTGYGLWTNLLAMTGKLSQTPANRSAGEYRLLIENNEATQLQSLGPHQFFGGIPLDPTGIKDCAARLGLPADVFQSLLSEPVRPIEDFLRPTQASQKELIICIGEGLEARWIRDHELWARKLKDSDATLVVIDHMPGPFLMQYATLCLPALPELASAQVYQSSEGRFHTRLPRRQAPPQMRSEATIFYDLLAEVSRLLEQHSDYRQAHPDLAQLSGYFVQRFAAPVKGNAGGLKRSEGEVDREALWQRLIDYCQHGSLLASSPQLATAPQSQPARVARWSELNQPDCLVRNNPTGLLCQDLYQQARPFRFFIPQQNDFKLPQQTVLVTGSTIPSPTYSQVAFALQSNFSQRKYWHPGLPQERWLYLSASCAEKWNLRAGDRVRLESGEMALSHFYPLKISNWLKGDLIYFDHYLSASEIDQSAPLPWTRFAVSVCPYSGVPLLQNIQPQLGKETADES